MLYTVNQACIVVASVDEIIRIYQVTCRDVRVVWRKAANHEDTGHSLSQIGIFLTRSINNPAQSAGLDNSTTDMV